MTFASNANDIAVKRRYKDGSLSDNLSISLALFVCSLSELNRF